MSYVWSSVAIEVYNLVFTSPDLCECEYLWWKLNGEYVVAKDFNTNSSTTATNLSHVYSMN